MDQIGIGLAGLGTVGAGVYKHLIQNRAIISERVGLELTVRRVAAPDLVLPGQSDTVAKLLERLESNEILVRIEP